MSKAGEQRLVLDLRNEALVAGFVGIAMQQMMQLRRGGEGENGQPKGKHQSRGGAEAEAERLLSFGQKLHLINQLKSTSR